jgi:hypothetical protein
MHCASLGQRESLVTRSKRTTRSESRIDADFPTPTVKSCPIDCMGDGATLAHAMAVARTNAAAHAMAKDERR